MPADLADCIDQARRRVLNMLDNDPEGLPGACLYHAIAVNEILGAPIVAGSYSWKFTNMDNGRNPTHFSCIFDQGAQLIARTLLAANLDTFPILPEMHVWNLWQGQTLDISTKHLPAFAHRAAGFHFEPGLTPPSYHFGKPNHKRALWGYKVDTLATQLARVSAEKLRAKSKLKVL